MKGSFCPSTVPRKHGSPRATNDVGKRDSTIESQTTPRRVQVTCTQERPSPLKLYSNPTSRELQRSSPSKPNKPVTVQNSRRKLPLESKSPKRTILTIFHTPSKPNPRDKIRQPTVLEPSMLVQKLPDKNTGVRVVRNSHES